MSCRKKIISGCIFLAACAWLITGCTSLEKTEDKKAEENAAESGSDTIDTSEMFSNRDMDFSYEEENAVKILLSDDGSSCDSENVEISDGQIWILEEGCYLLSGSLAEGQIVVEAEDTAKLQLVFQGVDVNCSTSAALYVKQADKVFVTLAEGTENHLSNREDFVAVDENNVDAVLFSKEDLTLNGKGSLAIDAACGHGVVSKDDLAVTGGNYQITAASHALSGKDSVRIAGGAFTLSSGKDGIQSDYGTETEETTADKGFIYIAGGEFQITAGDDGLQASSFVRIADGTFQIAAEDDGIHADGEAVVHSGEIIISKSYEGIEGQTVEITGGNIQILSADDGLNASSGNGQNHTAGGQREEPFASDEDCVVQISGGNIVINASGDGIDSNGNLYVSGGETYVYGPENDGNGALDYAGEAEITGGVFAASGASGMAQNFGESSSQGAMLATLQEWAEGTAALTDSSGAEVFSCTPEKKYNSILISTPDIQEGETYTLTAGEQQVTIEMTGLIYGAGGMGGGMGRPGQGGMPEDMGGQPGERMEPPGDMGERPEGEIEPPEGMGERPGGEMEPPGDMGGPPEEGMEPPGGGVFDTQLIDNLKLPLSLQHDKQWGDRTVSGISEDFLLGLFHVLSDGAFEQPVTVFPATKKKYSRDYKG